jgi:hypothetical protein
LNQKATENINQHVNQHVSQIAGLITNINLDNFKDSMNQIESLVETNKLHLEEHLNSVNFIQNLKDLIEYANEIEANTISSNSLTKCLNMVKESEELDAWTLRGGSPAGFYANQSNQFKKLYLKYKTKYLNLKKH